MFGDNSNLSLIEIAVSDLAFRDLGNASYSSRYILMPQEATDFENKRTELMAAAAALILDCSDFDLYYVEGQPTTNDYAAYWYNTAPGLGFPQTSSCHDMKLVSSSHCFVADCFFNRFCDEVCRYRRYHDRIRPRPGP